MVNYLTKYVINNILSRVVSSDNLEYMKADSGATKTYLKKKHQKYLENLMKLSNGPLAVLPNNKTIQAISKGDLPLHPLLNHSALVFPALESESLLSIGQVCDDGCIAVFDKKHLNIYKNDATIEQFLSSKNQDNLVLQGQRNHRDGLYDIPFPTGKVNYIVHKNKNKLDLAQYLHGCAFSPALSTFQHCVNKGNFLSWPGIDEVKFNTILKQPLATTLGHLDQERKYLQSTQQKEIIEDSFPAKIPAKTLNCFYSIIDIPKKEKAYTDQTGRFPCQSSRGNNYFFVCYNYDGNSILVEPIKNRETESIIAAWKKCHARLTKNGDVIKKYILDNECSAKFKDILTENEIEYELVPPHQHRRNAAERAIRTFKNHFLAGLATCDPDFPLREWDRLVTQAELTLNLLRNSRVNPNLSAWAYLFGNFDFNKSPLAPPGTKIVIHSKPANRKSWAFHGEQGWYIGPALHHYRCITVYIPKTNQERITDTAALIPKVIPIPNADIDSHLTSAADDIVHILKGKSDILSPKPRASVQNALIQIAQLLHRDKTPTISPIEIPNAISEGEAIKNKCPLAKDNIITSEGGDIETSHSRFKTIINPVVPNGIKIHPGLYAEKHDNSCDKTIVKPIKIMKKKTIQKQNPEMTTAFLDKLLAQFPRTRQAIKAKHKQMTIKAPSTFHGLGYQAKSFKRKNNIGKKNIISKKPYTTSLNHNHPMLLRRRNKIRDPNRVRSFKNLAFRKLLLQHIASKVEMFDLKGNKKKIDALLLEDEETWGNSLSNELGRLAQGIGAVKGNNALNFIPRHKIPKGKKVAYANMVCDHRPLKKEKFRVRLTLGGDVLEYEGNASSPAASLLEAKLLLNSVISDAHLGAKFMSIDLKDFFLQSILEEPEYIRIHGKYFVGEIRKKYHIDDIIAPDGYVYCEAIRGMYGLKQAAKLARDQLITTLKPFGYYPTTESHNIWAHTTRKTKFCLCVDDFGIKYYNQNDAEHLMTALRSAYEITVDMTGKNFCGLKLNWNYPQGFVDISMPDYVSKALIKLGHIPSTTPQHSPHRWVPITYGKKIQNAPVEDTSPLLPEMQIRHIQRIVGSFLYYARAIDNTIHPALNSLGSTQAQPTQQTNNDANMLMDYLNTHPNAKLRYHKSDMQLHIDSDAAYLVAPKAKSRVAGYFYLSDNTSQPELNAPVHIECALLKHVVSSAAEAETGGIFHNAKTAIHIKKMLHALGHHQDIIKIKTDNSTAAAFSNSTLKEKRSKSWDMRWWWLQDRVKQKEFKIWWDKGVNNLADYHTKHFPPSHHQKVRPTYILKGNNLSTDIAYMRGCVNQPLEVIS